MTSNQNTNKVEGPDKSVAFSTKVKEAYNKLSDDDIKLYEGKRDQFYIKLKEKQNVSKEDGEKKMKEIEATCASACNPEKTDNAKVA